jgi:GPI ethanolamine phosphate transferase 1
MEHPTRIVLKHLCTHMKPRILQPVYFQYSNLIIDATILDTWVFDHVEALFKNASSDRVLDSALRQDKNVFFLHLLGLDTSGHAYRPYSKEYLRNIKVVDEGVKATVKLVNDFYRDDATAWVFTADHGMSDWGSHGDGHPDNTRTPLIAWGAGINKPEKKNPTGHDEFSSDWYLDSVKRVDVNQADIAPLMVCRSVEVKLTVVISCRIEFSGQLSRRTTSGFSVLWN